MSAAVNNPWRLVHWTDAMSRVVREIACHVDELGDVINMQFPRGACCRDAVMELTNFAKRYNWFKRRWLGVKVGDGFQENINQGLRDCWVIAVDEHSGRWLYEYEMPAGRTFFRDQDGHPVSRKRVPKIFADQIIDE